MFLYCDQEVIGLNHGDNISAKAGVRLLIFNPKPHNVGALALECPKVTEEGVVATLLSDRNQRPLSFLQDL